MNGTTASPATSPFDAVAAFIRTRTGLVFGPARRPAFEAAIAGAVRRARLHDIGEYLALLATQPSHLDDLVAGITVGETYFFREPAQLDFICAEIIPDLLVRRPSGHRLRVWSAGCATGEEPYTLALIARALGVSPPPHIVATDISRAALSRAALGRYGKWSLRGLSEDVVRASFEPVGVSFQLDPSVRSAVEFGYLNLAEDVYPSLASGIWGMDLILCRNVLMYFDREVALRVARRLVDSLADGGWLLSGASDPLIGELTPCEVVISDAGLAYRRGAGQSDRRRRPADLAGPALEAPALQPPVSALPPVLPASLIEHAPSAAPEARQSGVASATLAEAQELYANRDYARAAEVAAELCGRDDQSAPWIVRVRSLANRGDLEAAGQHCSAAVERYRDCAELLYLHAVLLAQGGRHAEAASAARGALYLDRGLVVAHMTLGAALARLGDAKAAHRAFANAERLLAREAPDATVPASDGEPAGRLMQMVRMQLDLVTRTAA